MFTLPFNRLCDKTIADLYKIHSIKYKWVVTREVTLPVDKNDTLFVTIPEGFLCDGCSVPDLMQPLTDIKHWQTWLAHDYLYATHIAHDSNGVYRNITRDEADRTFKYHGRSVIETVLHYYVLKIAGKKSWATNKLVGKPHHIHVEEDESMPILQQSSI